MDISEYFAGAHFQITVTYGSRRGMVYAYAFDCDAAERLLAKALSLGYHDAKIEAR
jgi:hypothetical protein